MTVIPIKSKGSRFPYKNFVLGMIILQHAFENYLNWRQMKRLQQNRKIPSELKELNISEEEYAKSKEYTRAKLRFEIIHDSFSVLLQVLRIYFLFGPWLWDLTGTILKNHGYDASNEYYRAALLLILDSILDKVVDLPFDIYYTFVLEQKFGFNKNTPLLFLKDELITLVLKFTLGPLILSVFLWAVDKGGDYFYIWAEILVIIFVFIMLWIYPNFIAPLFNKFTELPDGTLKDALYKLADKVEFPLKKLFVCDGSKRSAHSNAYMYGFGNNKRIVLFDTLMNHLEEKQIEGVLCHEIGHWKKSHTQKQMIITFTQIFVLFYVYSFFRKEASIFLSFGYHEESTFLGLSLFLMVFSPLQFLFTLASLKLSRKFEFEADEFADGLGYGDELIHGLIRIHKENLSNLDPDPLYASFHYTHPTLVERIRHLNQIKSAKSKKE